MSIQTETRDILNYQGNIIGQLTLPSDTTEDQWSTALASYAQAPITPADNISNIILAARAFGVTLMAQFAAENVLMGLTEDQMDQCLTLLTPVLVAFNAGSLKIAIKRMNTIVPDGIILTPARIQKYRNMIEDFLGIPRT